MRPLPTDQHCMRGEGGSSWSSSSSVVALVVIVLFIVSRHRCVFSSFSFYDPLWLQMFAKAVVKTGAWHGGDHPSKKKNKPRIAMEEPSGDHPGNNMTKDRSL